MEEDSFWAGNATNVSCQDFRQYDPEKWPWTGSIMFKKLWLAPKGVINDKFSGIFIFESDESVHFRNPSIHVEWMVDL